MVKDTASDAWKTLCTWPPGNRMAAQNSPFASQIKKMAESVATEGVAWEKVSREAGAGLEGALLGARLDLGEDKHIGTALFHRKKSSGITRGDEFIRLKLISGIPLVYQMRRVVNKAKNDVVRFVEALDLMVLLNMEKKYIAATMTFCNQIASRFGCSRVSLGWLKKGYIRMQAISHIEDFEKKMDAVQNLEAAMEEAFDQDEEVVYPPSQDTHIITRDHESFALTQGVKHMISLPLRLDDKPIAVLSCERQNNPFSENDINCLRLFCDQAARRLEDLRKHGRWFGARVAESFRETLSGLLGVEHTLAKCVTILVCILLAILLFGKWNYRVEAPFIIKTDDLAYLPAPFDGYIHEAHVQIGDEVQKNDLLLTLDTRELLLEESSAIADKSRYAREAEKARAKNSLAEMKIAQALKIQAEAKLDLIRYHLTNAELKAPFLGIVVEGDLKELLGAPVRKGDVLFKIARIEKMYAELDLDERDVHEIAVGRTGEIAFVSMPNQKFPILVERIDPVAVPKEEGNVFPVRCVFSEEAKTWWRPGMSGIAKVNVGKRNLLWIFTHRTVDFFRFLLWW
ncbi:MAG: efflux RND transporter periplasmic adaptor subunit, partial [Deltaproteobacteria bacterium]|nr:efflux RND transporter periplasmic adaptor subunit [Deltaproteobacteria bacterium]